MMGGLVTRRVVVVYMAIHFQNNTDKTALACGGGG